MTAPSDPSAPRLTDPDGEPIDFDGYLALYGDDDNLQVARTDVFGDATLIVSTVWHGVGATPFETGVLWLPPTPDDPLDAPVGEAVFVTVGLWPDRGAAVDGHEQVVGLVPARGEVAGWLASVTNKGSPDPVPPPP